MRRTGPALALLALLLAAGCAPDAPADPGLVLRAGDGLLEHLPRMTLREAPRARVPAPVAEALGELLARDRHETPADAWLPGGRVQLPAQVLARVGVEGAVRRWTCAPVAALDLPLGDAWLEHEGRRLEPVRVTPGDPELRWQDHATGLLFWWDAGRRRLAAFGTRAPGAVAHGFAERGDGLGLAHWEPELFGGERSEQPAARLARRELGHVWRPALAVGAPAVLQLRVDELAAERLELVLAVPPLGLARAGPRVVRAPEGSDGVTFAVELVPLGAAAGADAGGPPPVQRVWSRHLEPSAEWVRAEVDLSAWTGRALMLRLVTEAGPARDARFDHALWAGLRLRGGRRGLPAHPHLVFLDADTLRADRLGMYGYERATSPRLDAWAAREAILFEQARAAADWTLPSTATLLTGLAVPQHAVTHPSRSLDAAHRPLAARLAAAGYETWARTDGGFVTPTYGFAEGFEVFDAGGEFPDRARDGSDLLARLAARRSERPVFLFWQTYETHAPFPHERRFAAADAPADGPLLEKPITEEHLRDVERRQGRPLSPDQQRYVSDLYDAGVARLDAQLGAFLEELPRALDGEPHVIVLTSDHGEELFERGALGHGHSLHRELLHVPLLFRLPGGPRGVRRADPVAAVDVVPSLLHVLGLPVPPELPGRVLFDEPLRPREVVAQHDTGGWSLEWEGFKLLHGVMGRGGRGEPVSRLYELGSDPAETRDLAPARPERHAALRARLEAWRAAHPARDDATPGSARPDAEQRAALRELGYLQDG